jgi:ribokinase
MRSRKAGRAKAGGAHTILNATPPVGSAGADPCDRLPGRTARGGGDDEDGGVHPGRRRRPRRAAAQKCAAIVTLGSEGAARQRGGEAARAAIPVEAVDTTAAGDAFAGGFAARLAEGASLADALRWAVAAGSLAVTSFGAAPSIPVRADLERLLGRPA